MTAATDLLSTAAPTFTGRSASRLFWERFREDKAALFGAGTIIFLIIMAIVGGPLAAWVTGHPSLTAYNQTMLDSFGIPKGPNSHFWFGADGSGRDLFVRVLYGARTSLFVAGVATTISMTVGVTVGVIAGYYRGAVDTIISRLSDVVLALPQLLLAIGIAAACSVSKNGCLNGLVQPGISLVVFVISAFTWPYIARIVRSTTLSLREKEFVEAARSLGASDRRIIFREILPNLVAPITIWATLLIPSNILFEAALSFLGVGVPLLTPSWGNIIEQGYSQIVTAPAQTVVPGIAILLTAVSLNVLGDGLRDALDPHGVTRIRG
jgi:peptide/nickel transport system permease protein